MSFDLATGQYRVDFSDGPAPVDPTCAPAYSPGYLLLEPRVVFGPMRQNPQVGWRASLYGPGGVLYLGCEEAGGPAIIIGLLAGECIQVQAGAGIRIPVIRQFLAWASALTRSA